MAPALLKDQMGLVEPPVQQHPLEYISRMLMEEEEEDRVLLQYDDDDPILVQAQQSLAHVISSTDDGNNASIMEPLLLSPDDTMMRSSAVYNPCAAAVVEHNWSNVASMSFVTGMVEASKLLPRHLVIDGDEAEVRRASKLMAMTEPEEEELHINEMMGRMMLNDCEVTVQEIDDLRAAIKDEAAARGKAWRQGKQQLVQVDLHALLVRCAESVMMDDNRGAVELLDKIKRHASPTGDATQRLAHCFAKALEARLACTARIFRWSMMPSSSVIEFLKAYRLFVATCCFKNVSFTFSNRTIYRAAAGRSRLHIIDYGIRFGFQWPGLLRLLAAREGGPPEVTITGIDLPQPGFRPASYIQRTGHLLSNCARELGVPFRFQAIAAAKWDQDLGIVTDDDEVLVVNSICRLEPLADDSVVVDRPSPRDVVLGNIRRMRPAVFTLGIVNGLYGSSFLTRFREALFYYSALFDMLDATLPRGSHQRLVMERDILTPFAINIIACQGRERTERFASYKNWHLRMQRAGLRQLPIDREVVGAIRDMVKKKQYHKDFLIDEDRQWLLQGWKGRILHAHSAWAAQDDSD